jgi:hypothetical protein
VTENANWSAALELLVRTQKQRDVREARMRNLDHVLRQGVTTPWRLAAALGCSSSYVTQLRIGFRSITPELAREIEAASGLPTGSLDDGASSGRDALVQQSRANVRLGQKQS